MDGDACAAFAGLDHGFMDPAPIHALAAVGREQRRMDVDDASGVAGYQKRRHHQQKASEHNQIDPAGFQQWQYGVRISETVGRKDACFHAETFGTADHTRLSLVGDHQRHLGPAVGLAEISDYVFGIRSVA